MSTWRLDRVSLVNFRSYDRVDCQLDGKTTYLFGPNGAGKTNLLEAISLLAPGRGLRGASMGEFAHRPAEGSPTGPWSIFARLAGPDGDVAIGTGVETADSARRIVRIDSRPQPPARLSDHLRLVWLTPAQDRLFIEGGAGRRRFLDRLALASDPGHGAAAAIYEKCIRERTRLLTADRAPDPSWLAALEASAAENGALMAQVRARTVQALQQEIDSRGERPFPLARLALVGEWETLALQDIGQEEISARLARALATSRARDASAGRALTGPHRSDLEVVHAGKGRPAADCSTGEQKALILNLILAQAARLSRVKDTPNPILLLDEVAAHLDPERRAALADEIAALDLQAFLSGTDKALFESFGSWARGLCISGGHLMVLEDE